MESDELPIVMSLEAASFQAVGLKIEKDQRLQREERREKREERREKREERRGKPDLCSSLLISASGEQTT